MSEVWAAAAVAVVGAGASAVVANNSKPKTAQYGGVDLQQQQTDALQGNMANQNSIEQLITRSNAFSQGQANTLAEQSMPGYTKLAASLTNRATTLADHPYDVPQEVQDNLSRIAAEKGISAGTRGEFNNFSLIKDLGINELQYGQQNISQAQSLTGLLATIAPKVNPASPMSFYVSPQQSASNQQYTNTQQQAISQGGYNASAAANADLWGSLTKVAGLYAGTVTNQPPKTTNTQNSGLPSLGGSQFGNGITTSTI